jgi:hypothetical protein
MARDCDIWVQVEIELPINQRDGKRSGEPHQLLLIALVTIVNPKDEEIVSQAARNTGHAASSAEDKKKTPYSEVARMEVTGVVMESGEMLGVDFQQFVWRHRKIEVTTHRRTPILTAPSPTSTVKLALNNHFWQHRIGKGLQFILDQIHTPQFVCEKQRSHVTTNQIRKTVPFGPPSD